MIACFGSCLAGNGGNRRDPLRFSPVDAMAATGCSFFFFPCRCGAANPLENGGSTESERRVQPALVYHHFRRQLLAYHICHYC